MVLSKVNTALQMTRRPTLSGGYPGGHRSSGRTGALVLCLVSTLLASACDPDKIDTSNSTGADVGSSDAGGSDGGGTTDAGTGTATGDGGTTGSDSAGNPPTSGNGGNYALQLPASAPTLMEGGESIEIDISIERTGSHALPVTLAVDATGSSDDGLEFSFADSVLDAGESETVLTVSLPIASQPRLSGSRSLPIVATDTSAQGQQSGTIEIPFEPTNRPDVYLLAGQSNMAGSSGEDAREADAGQPDAPVGRIFQLDVTINDRIRFPSPEAFTDIERIAVPDNRIVTALDPLHDTYDRGENGKSGTTIGLGLSFAKAALQRTTANIVLVPAAWSDTGFCTRESNRYEGMGWFGEAPDSPLFAGTLLHDRAIARTNLTLSETGGILRGILWHQGEADSDVLACANAYADNLAAMVASFRTNITIDARGASARGPTADIPFIAGTMSKGTDERAEPLAPFGEAKLIVDAAHRNIAENIPLSSFVNADDLVPSNDYPCGQGFCIHFGAEALRELGTRYHERMVNLFSGS